MDGEEAGERRDGDYFELKVRLSPDDVDLKRRFVV